MPTWCVIGPDGWELKTDQGNVYEDSDKQEAVDVARMAEKHHGWALGACEVRTRQVDTVDRIRAAAKKKAVPKPLQCPCKRWTWYDDWQGWKQTDRAEIMCHCFTCAKCLAHLTPGKVEGGTCPCLTLADTILTLTKLCGEHGSISEPGGILAPQYMFIVEREEPVHYNPVAFRNDLQEITRELTDDRGLVTSLVSCGGRIQVMETPEEISEKLEEALAKWRQWTGGCR